MNNNIINNVVNEDIIKFQYFIHQISELSNKITQLEKERDNLYTQNSHNYIIIKQKDDELILLRENNRNLLIEIEELQSQNGELKQIIMEQKNRIEHLEKELSETKKELSEIKDSIKIKEDKEEINKIILAIQDMNRIYELEKNINGGKNLSRLRNQRNKDCHYIDEYRDNKLLQIKKTEYVLYKISSISESIRIQFEKRYGNNMIQTIINYIQPLIYEMNNMYQSNILLDFEDYEITDFWEY